jgi:hypothetical protein
LRSPDALANEAQEQQPECARDPSSSGLRADVEIDPTAYAFSGYSLHAGFGAGRFRVDLGAFAMDLPQFVVNNPAFDVSFHGYGVKLQYFLFDDQRGGFVGVDAAAARALVAARDSALARRDTQLTAGVNFGWRFGLPANFYATTWLGVGYAFGAEVVELAGQRFEPQRVVVFPGGHLGYQVL